MRRPESMVAVAKRGGQLIVLISIAAGSAFLLGGNYQLKSVQSDSMNPEIPAGAAVLIDTRDKTIATGDVVAYATSRNPKVTITHRAVAVYEEQGIFTAKGDNTRTADQGVPLAALRGSVQGQVPLLGYGLDALRRPLGLAILVYLPAICLILSEVKRLSRYYGGVGTPHGYVRYRLAR